jgi:hypothetical protein
VLGVRPVGRVLAHRRLDQPAQLAGEPVGAWLVVDDPVQHRRHLSLAERGRSGRREDGDRTPREDIRGRGDRVVEDLFRRHVAGGADGLPDVSADLAGGVELTGEAEVDHFRPYRREQHVRRRQVAVHDAGGMDGAQRGGHAEREMFQVGGPQRAAPGDQLRQRRALDVLGDQVWLRSVGVGVEHGGRGEPADPAGAVGLPPEPGAELGPLRQLRPDHLDGDRGAVRRAAEEHGAHPALTQPPGDLVDP